MKKNLILAITALLPALAVAQQVSTILPDVLPPYLVCEQNTDGFTTFDLNDAGIVDNPEDYTFAYFQSQANASANSNALPLMFTNTVANTQTIYVRASPLSNPATYDIAPLTLTVGAASAGNPVIYQVCDENNDGVATFDLNSQIAAITGPGTYTVTFFETEDTVDPITNPGAYQNVTNPQTLYVTATGSNGCTATSTFTLKVLPVPVVENLFQIPFCNGDAIDITIKVDELENLSQLGTITYHTTEAAANAGTPAISAPETYVVNSEVGVSVWVRIDGLNADPNAPTCYTVVEQQLLPWHYFMYVDAPTDGTTATVVFFEGSETYDYTFTVNGQPTNGSFIFTGLPYGDNNITATNITCGGTLSMNFVIWAPAPTGETTQTFIPGETLANLEVTGTGIQWFTTPTGGVALPLNTPLVDGITYYAGQFINGYISLLRLAVTAQQLAVVNGNSIAALRYYPNPVKEVLTLTNNVTINGVTVINTLGQVVLQQETDATAVTINMAGLANGMYLVKVTAQNGEKTIKVVKE